MFNFGSKKWGYSEAENWLVFYGLGLPHIMRIAVLYVMLLDEFLCIT